MKRNISLSPQIIFCPISLVIFVGFFYIFAELITELVILIIKIFEEEF